MQLALSVKGEQTRVVPLGENGIFDETLEVSNGPNTLVFFAGVNIHRQNDWLRNSATLIRKFEGAVPVTRLLATLTWDQDRTDVDLYITEPQGETMWYRNLITSSGLELDFDDTSGFGPEHGTLKESGTQQVGDYRVRVHYYSRRGTNSPATGQVSVLVNEGLDDREFRTFPFRIQDSNSGADVARRNRSLLEGHSEYQYRRGPDIRHWPSALARDTNKAGRQTHNYSYLAIGLELSRFQ